MPAIQMPKWEADASVTHCNLCRNVFTFSRRKHHCRLCGKIYCQNCSNNQVRISRFYNYPQRICNGCYETIRDRSLQQRQEQFRFTEEYPEVPCSFNLIPDAVIIRILRFVPERNLLTDVALVSKHFHYLTNSNDLWKAVFFNHWAPQLVKSEMEGEEDEVEGLVVDLGRASAGDIEVYERYLKGSGSEGTIIRSPSMEEEEDGSVARMRVVYLDDDDFEEGHWKKLFKANIELDRRVKSTINYLPATAIGHILRYLSTQGPQEMLVARQVCRLWRELVDKHRLLQHACIASFACVWQPEGMCGMELGRHTVAVDAAVQWYGTKDFSALLPCREEGHRPQARTTPVHSEVRKLAVGSGSLVRLNAMLQHSGRAGANALDTANSSALHLAVRMQVPVAVDLLLAADADVNARCGGTGRTALQIALDTARGKQDTIVQLLLSAKADVSLQEYHLGETAIHQAVLRAPALLPLLLDGDGASTAMERKNSAGLSPMLYASSIGATSALQAMIEHSYSPGAELATDGRSALMLAASHGTPAMVQLLLQTSSDPGDEVRLVWRGQTAAGLARTHGKPATARILEEAERSRCAFM